jgi:hypothetical protein
MKKASRRNGMRREYKRSDFGTLVRGKYASRASEGSNVVVLDPHVARAFPSDRAVNNALKRVLRERQRGVRGKSSRARRAG